MFENIRRSLGDTELLVASAVVVLCISVLIWIAIPSPFQGTIYATLTASDGSIHAVEIHAPKLDVVYPTYKTGASVIAAIPSPKGDRAAYVMAEKGGTRSVAIGSLDGSHAVTVYSGTADALSWSLDGVSIAFSAFNGSKGASAGDPAEWTVLRAVPNGDSLTVGKGYKPFPSPNQHTFALTGSGITLLSYNDNPPSVVIQSPVPVPVSTPFTVSQDGMRVAWVAPADHSLQVYENVNGYFIPLLLKKDIAPQSMVFSPNGKYLLGATHTEATTTVSVIRVSGGHISKVGDVGGYLSLNEWLYEK